MRQQCCGNAWTMLWQCVNYVTTMRQLCYDNVSTMLRQCVNNVAKMRQQCCDNMSTMLPQCVNNVATMRQQCCENASTMLRQCVNNFATMRQQCYDNAPVWYKKMIFEKFWILSQMIPLEGHFKFLFSPIDCLMVKKVKDLCPIRYCWGPFGPTPTLQANFSMMS